MVNSLDPKNPSERALRDSIRNLVFEEEVEMPTFGDDSITSVSDRAKTFFNRKIKHEYLKARGILTTMPDKSPEVTPFCNEGEAEMLQRTFSPLYNTNIVFARLNEDSILNSLYFSSSSVSKLDREEKVRIVGQILESAAREYYMYGEEKFNWFVKSFRTRYENIGGVWNIKSFKEHDSRFKNAYFNSNYAYGNWDFQIAATS